jgi:hypothetical protein
MPRQSRPALAIRVRKLVRRHAFAVFLDETSIPVLTGKSRVHLEHLHRLAGRPARSVQLLLGAPFDEHVSALPLLIGCEFLLHLRGKSVELRKRPLLRGRCGEHRDEQSEDNQTAHAYNNSRDGPH